MEMDPLENISEKILGFSVKTRWQITLNYLIPCIVELLVYITVVVVDGALVYQHIVDENYLWAWISLGIVMVPAILTFICVILSDQWPIEEGFGIEKRKFLARLTMDFIFFIFCAFYRFSRKIFWCIESLFHARNTYERHHALAKASESSPFELYHFLQAFFHSGPQIIFQLFILLREDMFRNYDTAFVQALSVVFGFIKMSMSAESFQRFESQKVVGRNYPWLAPHQIQIRSTTFRRTLSAPGEISAVSDGVKINNDKKEDFRKTLNVNMNNFNENEDEKIVKKIDFVSNITDDDKLNSLKHENNSHVADEIDVRPSTSQCENSPDDDLFDNIEDIKEYLRRTADDVERIVTPVTPRQEYFDRIPSMPPPPRPNSIFNSVNKHPYLSRLSSFKDMLIFNAESFIKEKIPRIPEGMFEHRLMREKRQQEKKVENATMATTDGVVSPVSTNDDDADGAFLLPTRRKVIDGIESDDIVAKFISFLGWNFFLVMRIISLSVFSFFYTAPCVWLCFSHYILMLLCLINETRFEVKWQRTAFYTILSYIFIFNLIEFKIRFKHVRRWYICYFIIVFAQNIGITVAWYGFTEFLDTWWFEFMFLVILQSGIMSLMCFLLYFFYLKPKDKVFFVNE